MGNTFAPAVTLGIGTPLSGTGALFDASRQIQVRGSSVIMARPNGAANSVGVVWHQREADYDHTDVFFNAFQFATQTWRTAQHIGHTALNDQRDQWNPVLEVAPDGSYQVSWYDKRDDPNNNTYRVYVARISGVGTPLDAQDTRLYNAAAGADPATIPAIPPITGGLRFLGEYQDMWEWYGIFHSATIYIEGSSENVYMPRFTQ